MAMSSEHLLRLAHTYAAHRGLSLSTVSTYMGGSGDTLSRLARGHDMTTRRADRFIQWFFSCWPTGVEWPADIPRPKQQRKTA